VLILGRIALGLAIGVASYTAPLYIGEMAPPKLRGGLVTLNQLAITVGILVAYIIDAAFASSGNWRLMFGFGVLPALALGLGIAVLPESPRWLLLHQHKQEALKVLSRIREPGEIRAAAAFGRFSCTPSYRWPASGSAGVSFLKPRESPSSGSNGICVPGVRCENWERVSQRRRSSSDFGIK
jgi:MFS family permease